MEYDPHPINYVPRVFCIVSLSLMNGILSYNWFVDGMLAAEEYNASCEKL